MSRAIKPGARRRLAVAALFAATVGVSYAPAASAVTDDGTTEDGTTATSTTGSSSDGGPDERTEADARRADQERTSDRRDRGAADRHDEEGTAATTGDTGEPQPLSTADDNEAGANGDCPDGEYCSTRDGSSSANGSEDGEAAGRPCAGCVGAADNKNPQGQLPNGDEDRNRGYECDDNEGIGQGNPAHTGCAADGDDVAGAGAPVEAEVAGVDIAGVEVLVPRAAGVAGGPGTPAAAGPLAAVLPDTGSGVLVGLAAAAGLLMLGAGTLLLRRRAHG